MPTLTQCEGLNGTVHHLRNISWHEVGRERWPDGHEDGASGEEEVRQGSWTLEGSPAARNKARTLAPRASVT